jgi:hypothetical protein
MNADHHHHMRLRDVQSQLIHRIRAEFGEMPGLKLSLPQAQRLWNLDEESCRNVLDTLVADRFLYRTANGAFVAFPSALKMAKHTASGLPFQALAVTRSGT